MSATFWSNTIWYILLGITTVLELVFVLYKVERKKYTIAYYLTIAGIAFCIETLILIYLDSYSYYPKILKNPPTPFDDVLAGNVFSQFSVSASTLLFVALNLKFYWAFIIACIYGGIEELFLALGVFSHNWYRTWMTVGAFPVFFWVLKKIHIKIQQGIKPIYYYGLVLFALFPVWVIIYHWGILQLFGFQNFSTNFLPNSKYSKYTLAIFQYLLISIPLLLTHYYKLTRFRKVLVILSLYLINYICYKLNLFLFKEGWFFSVTTLSIFWMYFAVVTLDHYYRTVVKVSKSP